MIIVISPEEIIPDETETVNEMFQEGLELFHIRKPFISDHEMISFLDQINKSFRSHLVMHSHFELAEEYGISRLHIREYDRVNELHTMYAENYAISTSVHTMSAFNSLEEDWEYAFLSPFFPSISKQGYGAETTILEEVRMRNNQSVKLIALGGIHEDNIETVLNSEAEGVALLGAIWQSEGPLDVFMKCQRTIRKYNEQNK
ncbi:thiamine phosphate synthase [Chryseobacterium sp. T16E-39]|uniref:thiamine phosphate synthase n=1 Tax=Chryseobacterium sp. T16E-39 TaxID=2015076 RepID=UPI000B5B430E|nr:thiamine phosphate synthase [Chryseobacterium sp. T16E-39]ASK30985.1 thiamine phosphate synthase [Chryseobacterium sp. T16E-39]